MSESNGRSKLVDITKQVVPVAFLGFVVTCTYLVVGYQRDTQRAIENLTEKVETMRASAAQNVTATAFDNWRLRMQWANRTKDIDFSPDLQR